MAILFTKACDKLLITPHEQINLIDTLGGSAVMTGQVYETSNYGKELGYQ